MRRLLLVITLLLCSKTAYSIGRYDSICEQGNASVNIPGTVGSGSQKFQRSYPNCTITVYVAGTTTLATIYSDFAITPKPNPFTADSNGRFLFYAASGNYDIRFSGAGITSPWVIQNVPVFDSFPPIIVPVGPTSDCGSSPGVDESAKISACISNLPSSGGTAVATSLSGNQIWSTCPFTGVTKPVLLILGSGTITAGSFDCVAQDNIEVEMPSGSIYNSPGNIFQARLSAGSSISQHFTPSTLAYLPSVNEIHTRWFDDGTHTNVAIQNAINAVGSSASPPIQRSGQTVIVDDVLALGSTVIIDKRTTTVDCGGIRALSSGTTGGGFYWTGAANVPMIAIEETFIGSTIQNCRFYGNATNKPEAAISYVFKTGCCGQGQQRVINTYIGSMGGDTGYDNFSLVNGILVGSTFDSGTNGVNDLMNFDNISISKVTNGFNFQMQQNGLGYIKNSQVQIATKGVYTAAGDVTMDNIFFASVTDNIYTALTDAQSNSVYPKVYGYNVQSEGAARLVYMAGGADVTIRGGSMALNASLDSAHCAVDTASSTSPQYLKMTEFVFQDQASIGTFYLCLREQFGSSGTKRLLYDFDPNISAIPTMFVPAANVFDHSYVCKEQIMVPPTGVAGKNYPVSCNIMSAETPGAAGNLDQTRYDIPAKCTRLGDAQNLSGTMEYCVATATLNTTSGSSVTATGLIPANVTVLGVTSRIPGYPAGGNITCSGCATVRLGTVASPTKWATSLTLTENSSTSLSSWNIGVVTGPYNTQSAEDVVVSTNAGTFTGGHLVVTANFIRYIAPPGY